MSGARYEHDKSVYVARRRNGCRGEGGMSTWTREEAEMLYRGLY